ncbi:hypothetical protein [uncultured Olleya sp.]|uniref:hypothetical protein n=1 Tax=uncultured Olleya sp. TaxID=757243 RepID=UPI0025924DC8|nr:hypothetical protein [uncultured Olleya sp.]
MKYISKILYLFIISVVVTSCDRDLIETDFDQKSIIFFNNEEGNLFVEENGANIINIAIGSTATSEGNVGYTITVDPTSTAVEGEDFNIVNTSTSFANGEIVTNLIIEGDFTNAVSEGKIAKFILSSNEAKVSENNTFELNLFQFCPFEGVLTTTSYAASVFAFDDEAPSHDVVLTPVTGTTNQWTIATSWGPNFVSWATADASYDGQYLYSGTIIVNDDFTLDFIGNDAWATGGTGSFSPCTQEFSMTLTQGLFSTSFTTDVVLSPM